MKAHVIVAAAALAFCLLLSAVAPSIDKGASDLDYQKVKVEARFRSLKSLADNTFTVEGVPGYFTDLREWRGPRSAVHERAVKEIGK